jgi:transmembrane sensor
MSNVHAFESKDTIQEQACLWVSKIDRGLSEQEHQELLQWVALGSAHLAELKVAAEFWDETSVLQELSSLFPLQSQEKHSERSYWRPAVAIACSVLLVALVLNFLPATNPMNEDAFSGTHIASSSQTIITAIGQNESHKLSDGSVVQLNTNSELLIEYTPTIRRLNLLKGEAHFEVAHDANRPFSVHADNINIVAIGTAFNIELGQPGDIELLVTDGKVLITDQGTAVGQADISALQQDASTIDNLVVSSGEKARLNASNIRSSDVETEKVTLAQVQNELAWQQGMLVFQGESLLTVLEEVKRYNDIDFDFDGDAIGSIKVAGYFKAGDISGLISTLESNFNIKHEMVTPQLIKLSSTVSL